MLCAGTRVQVEPGWPRAEPEKARKLMADVLTRRSKPKRPGESLSGTRQHVPVLVGLCSEARASAQQILLSSPFSLLASPSYLSLLQSLPVPPALGT